MMNWFSDLWRRLFPVPDGPPTLVATYEGNVRWIDRGDITETVTYMLFETPGGKRSWKSHSYGYVKALKSEDLHSAPACIWAAGGPLPDWAVLTTPTPSEPKKVGHLTLVKE